MQRLWLDRNRLLFGNPGQVLIQRLEWNAPEVKALAAAQDRGQDPLGIGCGQHEHHLWRWFFQGFEQRIKRCCGEHVALIHHVHLPARLHRGESGAFDEIANVVDTGVGRGIDLDHIKGCAPRNRGAQLTSPAGLGRWAIVAEAIE